MKLQLKVVPGASREAVEWLDEAQGILKVRVIAAPEKGKANRAVIRLLAKHLGLPASAVTIVSGTTGPYKTVAIDGLSDADIRAAF